jgi:hypothetical protein
MPPDPSEGEAHATHAIRKDISRLLVKCIRKEPNTYLNVPEMLYISPLTIK